MFNFYQMYLEAAIAKTYAIPIVSFDLLFTQRWLSLIAKFSIKKGEERGPILILWSLLINV
ncbi:hypothetical protein Cantr_00655 [Candida viswanathii]|uniref:Uncharacterized protein n=1 Tax=Candida viswanathii TaxID=5486 RepID=A0A367YG80_9ASCO|nr:hypothetical protein Cantr_00655 [Candida viswanathii]